MTEKARILLVDDSEDARDIALAALAAGQFENVETAGTAMDAYDLLGLPAEANAEEPPAFDLVLLDIIMPDIDGVEACAFIRSSRRYRDIPILMVSLQSDAEVLNQAFMAGANDYLTKPVTPIEILARVRAALRYKREIDRRLAREAELQAQANIARDTSGIIVDPVSGFLGQRAVDEMIGRASDRGWPTAIALLNVESHAEYLSEMGAGAAEKLICKLSREIGGLAAPLGTVLGYYGEGQFIVAGQHMNEDAMRSLVNEIEQRLEMLQIEHGASAHSDHVRLVSTIGSAQGDGLRRLPAQLITQAESLIQNYRDRFHALAIRRTKS